MEVIHKDLSLKIVDFLKKKRNSFKKENSSFRKMSLGIQFSTIVAYIKRLNEKKKKRGGLVKKFIFISKVILKKPSMQQLLLRKIDKHYHFRKRKKRREGALFDPTDLLNLLKVKSKFEDFKKKTLKYCKLFFKYTGSNFFVTLTNMKGDVFFSYSAGVFQNLRTRKEKTTIFVAKELGELLGLRLLKLLTKETIFIPFLNHRKIKTLLRFFFSGVSSLGPAGITRIMPKRKVARNGVRLKKAVRK